jgi:two-component system, LytTR family, sensor histidine kinase AlgZ
MQLFIQRHRVLLLHSAFWCLYFSFFFYQVSFPRRGQETDLGRAFLDATIHIGCMMGISYLNYFVFLPRFLKHKHFFRYLLEFIAPFAGFVAILIYIKRILYFVENDTHQSRFLYSDRFMVMTIFATLFIVIFVAMLKFVEDWFELEAKQKALENEKLSTELQFLKAQINPHFFFNTLNNIYALTVIDVEKAQEAIHKLSRMMRYVLYDTQTGTVQLSKELDFVRDYIQLMQLRLTDKVKVCFESPATFNDIPIAPMLLLPFIENAFKHGVNATKPSSVFIGVKQQKQELEIEIRNTLFAAQQATLDESNGIGLVNTRRRLDLLYPDRYELAINSQSADNEYVIKLKLKNAS